MAKNTKIRVGSTDISVILHKNENDFISLTDMMKAKDGDFYITDWLRNRNTLEYIGTWEQLNNPDFNYGEFAIIRNNSGLNSFKISVKEFVSKTNAISITAKAGRYGGTYAHKDIAFHFGMWISPAFQLYIVKEYQRLRTKENDPMVEQWDIRRIITKANYSIHTDAIQNFIVPHISVSKTKERIIYASEADLLNLALFGYTAKDWEEANPTLASKHYNMRDTASINQLVVLSNLESLNAELIKKGVPKPKRLTYLHQVAKQQLSVLDRTHTEQKFRKLSNEKGDKKLIE